MKNTIYKAFVGNFSRSLEEVSQMCTCQHFKVDSSQKLFRCVCGGTRREAGMSVANVLWAKAAQQGNAGELLQSDEMDSAG